MPQLSSHTPSNRSTKKKPVSSIAVFCSPVNPSIELKQVQDLGKELARQGQITCISTINDYTRALLAGTKLHHGITISYLTDESQLNGLSPNDITHTVFSNTIYEHCVEMMLHAASAVIVACGENDIVRPFAQPLPKHVILGVLTSPADISRNIADLQTVTGISNESILLDSSPAALVQRMLKLNRQRQLRTPGPTGA